MTGNDHKKKLKHGPNIKVSLIGSVEEESGVQAGSSYHRVKPVVVDLDLRWKALKKILKKNELARSRAKLGWNSQVPLYEAHNRCLGDGCK